MNGLDLNACSVTINGDLLSGATINNGFLNSNIAGSSSF